MAVNTDRIQYLFRLYLQKACTREELQELFTLIAQPENRAVMEALMDAEYEALPPLSSAEETDWEYIFSEATKAGQHTIYPLDNRRPFSWVRVAAAAVIVLALGLGGYWFMNRLSNNRVAKTNQPVEQKKYAVQPGGNKAVLTLADGRVISLNDAANGALANEGSSIVSKTKDGELEYKSAAGAGSHREQPAVVAYNTLATPRGGQYQLVLPDGTKVWLNAASSIRYSVVFAGHERSVELTGEAYFEVAPVRLGSGQKMPFHVKTATQDVEVLGTHFNVNAYDDEPATKTTLLEGSVKVTKDAASVILKPGEQTAVSQRSQPSHPIPVQTDEVIAWKNGLTAFTSADLKSILRQVARWYNVEVVYEGDIPQRTFTGGISRNAPLAGLLRLLEVSKVHFRMEGNRLIVMP